MTFPGKVETTEVKDTHRIDEMALASYLATYVEGFASDLEVRQFPIGQSNPTYQLISGGKKYVLRKKPPGKLLPSAHAVDREYRVISALEGTGMPVPPALHLCEDPEVIGTEFFVMGMVEGRVFHDPSLPGLEPQERCQFYNNFITNLAILHAVDFNAAGLSDFGRAEGYIERQVARWSKQYEASKTDEILAMDAIINWLPKNLPADQSVSIVHGDYRPGNMICHPNEPRIVAALDWELSTLGHPLADLGYCCAAYHTDISAIGQFAGLDYKALGLPSEDEFIELYCRHSGRCAIDDYYYYVVFSLFRSAAIIQGVYKRGLDGNASSELAVKFDGVAAGRAEVAWALVQKHY